MLMLPHVFVWCRITVISCCWSDESVKSWVRLVLIAYSRISRLEGLERWYMFVLFQTVAKACRYCRVCLSGFSVCSCCFWIRAADLLVTKRWCSVYLYQSFGNKLFSVWFLIHSRMVVSPFIKEGVMILLLKEKINKALNVLCLDFKVFMGCPHCFQHQIISLLQKHLFKKRLFDCILTVLCRNIFAQTNVRLLQLQADDGSWRSTHSFYSTEFSVSPSP